MLLKLKKNKKGFTLIELIVAVAILAILAVLAIPTIIGLSDTAKAAVEKTNAATIAQSINIHNAATTGAKILTKPTDLAALNGMLKHDGEDFSVTITGSATEISAAYTKVDITPTGVATFH